MLLRNVGHLMTNPAILVDGEEVFLKGIMDALVTPLLTIADIRGQNENKTLVKVQCISLSQNARSQKKLHLQLNCLSVQNRHLACQRRRLKIRIMDEERRTSVNPENCIAAAKRPYDFH